jgi:hypothetical protein
MRCTCLDRACTASRPWNCRKISRIFVHGRCQYAPGSHLLIGLDLRPLNDSELHNIIRAPDLRKNGVSAIANLNRSSKKHRTMFGRNHTHRAVPPADCTKCFTVLIKNQSHSKLCMESEVTVSLTFKYCLKIERNLFFGRVNTRNLCNG